MNLDEYFKPLSGFLNDFSEKYQNPSAQLIEQWTEDFEHAIDAMNTLYGELAFRPFDKDFKAQNAINTALFDAQMVAVHEIRPDLNAFNQRKREQLWINTANLLSDPEFSRTIGAGTSSKTSVTRRIRQYSEFLQVQNL